MQIEIAVLVSILALIISGTSLWFSHFSGFSPYFVHGDSSLRFDRITPEISGDKDGRSWWIPSIDSTLQVCNLGQSFGILKDAELVFAYKGNEETNTEIFKAKWIVDTSKFKPIRHNRFQWIKTSIVSDWHPFILGAKASQTLHLVFEGRRLEDVFRGNLFFYIQLHFENQKGKKSTIRSTNNFQISTNPDMFYSDNYSSWSITAKNT